MRIQYRLLLGFASVLALGLAYWIYWTASEVNIQPKKAMEESLVDLSNIIAAYLEIESEERGIDPSELSRFMKNANQRELKAHIYELDKNRISLRILVSDHRGIIIFDSQEGADIGKDYSKWNDIRRTLNGEYGARTTRQDPDNPSSSIAYISAPIYLKDRIIGVCTVAKSWKSIHRFTQTTRNKILMIAISGFLIILFLSYLISIWITGPIKKLTLYAEFIRDGYDIDLPKLGKGEIRDLGKAFEKMKDSLDGKRYIEKYIQNLTHQLKGPLSSIKGASELLKEELPDADRERFIRNIETESVRIQRIIDHLLELAVIERRKVLEKTEVIELKSLIDEIVDGFLPLLSQKGISISNHIDVQETISGDPFLLGQAISNLISNSIDFSPSGESIIINTRISEQSIAIDIIDNGTGIPDYALKRVFEKFYSLSRPGSGQKSSGLGLSFVQEIAKLHQGDVTLVNNPDKGLTASLKLRRHIRRRIIPFSGF